ncbi:hypothetical protein [Nitrincola sp. MINF-07-Sa-05]|uniref:hypothetical protein n=1 Tax=Nitrincola salilacus TaxID=3400273 RepID=UPI003917E6EB
MNVARSISMIAVVLTTVFVALFAWGWLKVKLMSDPEPWLPAPESLSAVVVTMPQAGGVSDEVVLDRPLFWAGRRPYIEPEASVAVTEEPSKGNDILDKTRLLGAYMAPGAAGVILDVDGSRERLLMGETLGEWTLRYMSSMGAVFGKGEEQDGPGVTRTITLEHAYPTASVRPQSIPAERRPLESDEQPSSDDVNEG